MRQCIRLKHTGRHRRRHAQRTGADMRAEGRKARRPRASNGRGSMAAQRHVYRRSLHYGALEPCADGCDKAADLIVLARVAVRVQSFVGDACSNIFVNYTELDESPFHIRITNVSHCNDWNVDLYHNNYYVYIVTSNVVPYHLLLRRLPARLGAQAVRSSQNIVCRSAVGSASLRCGAINRC